MFVGSSGGGGGFTTFTGFKSVSLGLFIKTLVCWVGGRVVGWVGLVVALTFG